MSDFAERGNAFHVEKHFGEMEKAKSKARGVIGSSRLGAHLDGLSEHKELSRVFIFHFKN